MRKRRLIVVLAVLLVAAAVIVGYVVISGRGPAGEASADEDGANGVVQPNLAMGPGYTFDTFIVNVAGTGGRRYLKCTITVEFDKNAGVTEAGTKVPLLRDAMIDILSSKTLDDLEPGPLRDALRGELVSTISSVITKARVMRVFFNEFVVQ
ncbi:MAG TPA: flagellar basal body-associated FliL family protein [Bacillota bacterium]|nr:flagellar basal body-associated FliL family protein [Bacillota bacterium]